LSLQTSSILFLRHATFTLSSYNVLSQCSLHPSFLQQTLESTSHFQCMRKQYSSFCSQLQQTLGRRLPFSNPSKMTPRLEPAARSQAHYCPWWRLRIAIYPHYQHQQFQPRQAPLLSLDIIMPSKTLQILMMTQVWTALTPSMTYPYHSIHAHYLSH
jgi:hypothetical protein